MASHAAMQQVAAGNPRRGVRRNRRADECGADASVPVRLSREALAIGAKVNKGEMKW